ncbi:hypothetical protein SZ54_5006 [Rhizobium sp. UR51a]|uniref:hypothetical protein n=1 Tax=Agrobacterium pusense TaxID=648995 RepID=UPI0005C9119A|nr:hypothetical protein BLX90_24470 [Rhizobium sp. Y9]KIV60805.1 hypothetical protein SZ54_5006 [Rhizobium sp. UR51a]
MKATLTTNQRASTFDVSVIDALEMAENRASGDQGLRSHSLPNHPLRFNSPIVELTLMDLIHDPLVASLNRADGVSFETYMQLLLSAASVNAERFF